MGRNMNSFLSAQCATFNDEEPYISHSASMCVPHGILALTPTEGTSPLQAQTHKMGSFVKGELSGGILPTQPLIAAISRRRKKGT